MARQRGVEIELLDRRAVIVDLPTRQHLEIMHQRLGLGAPVGFDVAGDDIHAGGALLVGGLEHGVGFAHAGRGAKEDLQSAARPAGLDRPARAPAADRDWDVFPYTDILNQKCRQCGIRNTWLDIKIV